MSIVPVVTEVDRFPTPIHLISNLRLRADAIVVYLENNQHLSAAG